MRLTIDDLKTLDGLLQQALDLPPERREGWVASLPPEHARFASLLRDHLREPGGGVETADFLATLPRLSPQRGDREAIAGHGEGERVGPYELVKPVGEGGMGTVWLARRADGAFERSVALKLPHRHLLDRGLAERMARERDILATLNDDRIARLYEAGVAGDGTPFLALEFVAGTPIDAYCAAHGPSLEVRVGLMAQVARAVAHAHANLVVHRDLKPSNVLVTAGSPAPGVKLLDFGVAKMLAAEGDAGAGGDLTRALGQALTPDYASPEQVLDRPLTTASDIYSLGVLLYQVACGEKPYTLGRQSAQALADAIVNAAIVRPSRRAASAGRPGEARRIRGDLDAIILKAMKPAPGERYATASALADDLERFLARQPVLAQPDSFGYRARRFVRRHAVAVGAGIAVGLALAIGAGAAAWQARQARLEAAKTAAVKDFLVSVFTAGSIDQEDAMLRRKRPIGDVLVEAAGALPGRFTDQPEIRAELQQTLGDLLYQLGLAEPARSLTDARVRDLDAIGAPLADRMQARIDLAMAIGDSTEAMARVAALLDEAVVTLEGSREARSQAVLARALTQRAMLKVILSGGKGAVEDASRAAELAARAAPATRGHADALVMLGFAQGYGGDMAAAERTFASAIPVARALPGQQAAVEASIHTRLVEVLMRNDDYPRALDHANRALAIIERFSGADSFSWARTAIYAGFLEGRAGAWAKGDAILARCEANFGRFGGDISPEFLGAARAFRAQVLAESGQLAQAREIAEASWAPYAREAPGQLPAAVQRGASRLGLVLHFHGDYERSAQLFRRSLAVLAGVGGATTPDALASRRLVALNEAYLGRAEAAIAELGRIVEEDRSPPGRLGAQRQPARIALARLHLDRGELDAASRHVEAVSRELEGFAPAYEPFRLAFVAQVEGLAGELALRRGDARAAVARLARAVAIHEARQPPGSPFLASARADLAVALAASGDRVRARELAAQARKAFAAHPSVAPHLTRSLAAAERALAAPAR
jgi:serine/threonine-protein kinase